MVGRLLLVLAAFGVLETLAFSWGTTQCAAPMHMARKAFRSDGVKVSRDDGQLHISSATPIRGFLIVGRQLRFFDPPEHSQLTDVCGADSGAVMHSDSTPRDSVSVSFDCEEGLESAEVSIYLVFGYNIAYVSLTGRVHCPSFTTTVSS